MGGKGFLNGWSYLVNEENKLWNCLNFKVSMNFRIKTQLRTQPNHSSLCAACLPFLCLSLTTREVQEEPQQGKCLLQQKAYTLTNSRKIIFFTAAELQRWDWQGGWRRSGKSLPPFRKLRAGGLGRKKGTCSIICTSSVRLLCDAANPT